MPISRYTVGNSDFVLMSITADFKIAPPTKKVWSGVFGHTPDSSAQVKLQGEMFAVMSIKAEINFDLGNLASLLQDELQSTYFKTATEPTKLQDFESALLSVNKRISQIMDREPELAQKGVDFEMLVGIIRSNTLYLGVVGESKVMVSRGQEIAEISGVLIDTELDGFARTGSVKLEEDDRLLFLTSAALKQLGEDGSEEILTQFDIEDVELKEGAMIVLGYDLDPEWLAAQKEAKKPVEKVEEPVEVPALAATAAITTEPESVDAEDEEGDLEENSAQDDDDVDYLDEEGDEDLEEEVGMVDKVKTGVLGAFAGIRTKMALNRDGDLDGEYSEIEQDTEEDLLVEDTDKIKTQQIEDDYYEEDEEAEGEGIVGKITAAPMAIFAKLKDLRSGALRAEADDDSDDDEVEVEDDDMPSTRSREMMIPTRGARNIDVGNMLNQGIGGLKEFADRSKETIRSLRHGRPGSRGDYVRGGRKPGLYIAPKWRIVAVVMVVAIVVVIFGIRQTVIDNERRAYEQDILDQVDSYDAELERLSLRANTASIGSGQEAEKESLIRELDALAAKAQTLKSEELGVSTLNEIISQVQVEKDTIQRVNAFTQPQLVADLAVNFQGVDAVDIEYSEGQLYVADNARGVVYRMATNIQSEANNFVTGLSKPRMLSVDEDGDLVFVDQGTESIIGTIDISDGSVRRQPGLSSDRVGNLSAIFVWNNNAALYSINTSRPAIMKQNSVAGNFQIPGDGSVWRTDGELATAKDLAVDGSVYALIDGIGMKRYFGGEPATMSINGLLSADEASLKKATKFELTGNRLYIADAPNKRILVFSLRNGGEAAYDFEEQIIYRGNDNYFSEIRDIVVVPGQQSERLFVLDGPRVIRIDR